MEKEGGVRHVWIEINGIRLRFIFDTGASSICISPAEAEVLFRQGIGDLVLDNVKATVVDNVNAPLLLGQTVLERFGSIEIDNNNNEIIFK